MRPMHSETTRLSRCSCCQSKHSRNGARQQNSGKSSARQKAKRDIRRSLDD